MKLQLILHITAWCCLQAVTSTSVPEVRLPCWVPTCPSDCGDLGTTLGPSTTSPGCLECTCKYPEARRLSCRTPVCPSNCGATTFGPHPTRPGCLVCTCRQPNGRSANLENEEDSVGNQPGETWSESAKACIRGLSKKFINGTASFEACKDECVAETAFYCASVEYYPPKGLCELNKEHSSTSIFHVPCFSPYEEIVFAERIKDPEAGRLSCRTPVCLSNCVGKTIGPHPTRPGCLVCTCKQSIEADALENLEDGEVKQLIESLLTNADEEHSDLVDVGQPTGSGKWSKEIKKLKKHIKKINKKKKQK